MKKLLFILLLSPLFVFSQKQYYPTVQEYVIQPVKVDTAVVYTQTGTLDFNKSVGGCLISGGVFLFLGTTIPIVTPYITKKISYNPAKVNNAMAWVGYSMIGISAACFIASGVIYKKQDKLRNKVVISASPTTATITYNF